MAPISIRESLRAEDARIEALLERAIAAASGGGEAGARLVWDGFAAALRARIDAEDAGIVSLLPYERSVRILSHEHRYLRGRLVELGDDGARAGRPGVLEELRDILRAHARNDDQLLYRWAEDELDPEQRARTLEAISARLAQIEAVEASSDSIVATNSATFTGFVR
jgi:hypothetical protein